MKAGGWDTFIFAVGGGASGRGLGVWDRDVFSYSLLADSCSFHLEGDLTARGKGAERKTALETVPPGLLSWWRRDRTACQLLVLVFQALSVSVLGSFPMTFAAGSARERSSVAATTSRQARPGLLVPRFPHARFSLKHHARLRICNCLHLTPPALVVCWEGSVGGFHTHSGVLVLCWKWHCTLCSALRALARYLEMHLLQQGVPSCCCQSMCPSVDKHPGVHLACSALRVSESVLGNSLRSQGQAGSSARVLSVAGETWQQKSSYTCWHAAEDTSG